MVRSQSKSKKRGKQVPRAPRAQYLGRVLFFWKAKCTADKLTYDRVYLSEESSGARSWSFVTLDTTKRSSNTENIFVNEAMSKGVEREEGFVRLYDPQTGMFKAARIAWIKGARPVEDAEVARLAGELHIRVSERYGPRWSEIGTLEEMHIQFKSPNLVGRLLYSVSPRGLDKVAWIYADRQGSYHILKETDVEVNSDPDRHSICAIEMQGTTKYEYPPRENIRLTLIYRRSKLDREIPEGDMWELVKKIL